MPAHRQPSRREAAKVAAARHRQLKRRRGRVALLAGSVLATVLVAAAALVWPAEEAASEDREITETSALSGRLPTVATPSPEPEIEPTKEPEPEPTPEPDPTDFPASGPGTFRIADVIDVAGSGAGNNRSFTVEVEDGLPQDPDQVASQVSSVLGDQRGWRSQGWSFTQVSSNPQFRLLLASPATVDRLCYPLRTFGEVSCRNGNRVVLNVKRWALGVEFYGNDLQGYRTYLINHEVGHALGKGHVGCPAAGAPAPVMLQQTKGLQGCVASPWP